jgi:hypothetical protein
MAVWLDSPVVQNIRAHIILPKNLVAAVDRTVGHRKRSAFIAQATAQALARERLILAARKAAGSVPDGAIPEWETPESTAAWVHQLRQEADTRIDKAWEDR